MRSGLGNYALGTALTGRTADEIHAEISEENRQIYELLGKLAVITKLEVSELKPKVFSAMVWWRKSKVELLQHLLATTPTNLKFSLNLKDYQYNPQTNNEKRTDGLG